MLHRLSRGEIPAKHHIAHYHQNQLTYEHCFTRQGFDGNYAILYHQQPPHIVLQQDDMGVHPGLSQSENRALPQRRHFQSDKIPQGGTAFLGRQRLLQNRDLEIWFGRADQPDPTLVCNADADELVYIYQGRGVLETMFGILHFQAEDYVYIPRSTIHRWVPETPLQLLFIAGLSWIDIPKQFRNASGQLKMDAPYSHRDFREPQWHPELYDLQNLPFEVIIQRQGHLHRQALRHHPFEIVGWDGQVWPFVFPIRNFQPRTGQVHLPPTAHTTFVGGGFVICSFVPRIVDFHPQAIPCPYPHSSVDCDEFLFYVDGNFTSRKGIGSGSISFHPMGLPHGPHPGRYEASLGTTQTDELAVMVDTFVPLLPTANAQAIEEPNYHYSWSQP